MKRRRARIARIVVFQKRGDADTGRDGQLGLQGERIGESGPFAVDALERREHRTAGRAAIGQTRVLAAVLAVRRMRAVMHRGLPKISSVGVAAAAVPSAKPPRTNWKNSIAAEKIAVPPFHRCLRRLFNCPYRQCVSH